MTLLKIRIKYRIIFLLVALIITIGSMPGCIKDDTLLKPEVGEEYSGGETTKFNLSPEAFGFKAPNLHRDLDVDFGVGNSLFRQNWVTAPASATARDGLGPFFNARSCSGCHFKDGRGRGPIYDGEHSHGMLLRLSIPGISSHGDAIPDPIYGDQFQDNSILSAVTEGGFTVIYADSIVNFPDGTSTTLRKPSYHFNNLAYGDMSTEVLISPRVGPQMCGLGLLEAIPESTLLSYEDEHDADNDGISGRLNYVWNVEAQAKTIGRFGWKANMPNIRQQVAGAFSGDLGITSSIFPEENCPTGVDCKDFVNGGEPEITDKNFNKVVIYSSVLNVPGRRNHADQEVLEGKKLFNSINCIACHKPKIVTGPHFIAALENQTIRPYTDLLLHDMGPALSDNRRDFEAEGNEWRTQPLWGIGLIETVNNHTALLHDARARNVEEAILWHGGEATDSRDKYVNLTSSERLKVLKFINSL